MVMILSGKQTSGGTGWVRSAAMVLALLTPQAASAGVILFLNIDGSGLGPESYQETLDYSNVGNEAVDPTKSKSGALKANLMERGVPAGSVRAEGSVSGTAGFLKNEAQVGTPIISSDHGYYFNPSYRADAHVGLIDQLTVHADDPTALFAPLHMVFDLTYALAVDGGLPPLLVDGTEAIGGDAGASINFDIFVGDLLSGFMFNVNGVAGTGASWGLPDPSEDGVASPFNSVLASLLAGGEYAELLNVTETTFGFNLNRAYTIAATLEVPVDVPFSLRMNSFASAGCTVRHNCKAFADFGNSLFASISTGPGFSLESAYGYNYTGRAPGEVTPVPEPGTLGFALAGLGAYRAVRGRRRRALSSSL
jgi:hypothetical protein